MRATIRCADAYEAQKLAGMASVAGGGDAQLAEVIDVIGSECIVSLRDRTAHSVLLRDEACAAKLADFVQSVADGAHRITRSRADGADAIIEKA